MPEHLLLWIVFNVLVLGILVLDLGVFHREAHVVSLREALVWSCIWVSLALLFGLGIYGMQGGEKSLEFMAGYLIEWSLSVDNLFVFLVIFSYFAVPAIYQHRLLFWGILGALVLRAVFIATGTALLSNFHWMVYVFGVFLIFTGIKLMFAGGDEIEPEKNPAVRLVRRFIKITAGFEGQRFFVRKDGKLWATPLFLVLVVIETTDVIFALDSIPAIFAITLDPFIVYTSNVFAILGLRALFFLLAGVMGMFRYLKVGLSFVLCFVGVKMTIVNFYKIPIGVSLGVVAGILAISVLASLMIQPKSALDHAPGLAPDPLQRSGTAVGEAASWRSSIWSWLLVIAVVMAVVAAISTCTG